MPRVISIDEFRGNSGGHRYQCILTDPKKKRVLDVLPSRRQDELCRYFGQFKNHSQVKIRGHGSEQLVPGDCPQMLSKS
ncbi:transposase [Emergencia timonensis]|nr:transposase [Emergencia timonensis]WNX90320.1 transposase [Emergencia timonensis]